MEEVWKGISLSSLHNRPTSTTNSTFQDFLVRPSSKLDPPPPPPPPPPTTTTTTTITVLAPPPATVLSLSSGSEFHYLESSSDRTRSLPQLKIQSNGGSGIPSLVYSFNSPSEPLASSMAASIPSFFKKRALEEDDNSGDWRHKRMIKNRESAARSRSRKQAYTNGLENEVNRLMEENAKLRRQLQKLSSAATDQLPKKNTLQRTLTAPF